jgi:hypothetical protein
LQYKPKNDSICIGSTKGKSMPQGAIAIIGHTYETSPLRLTVKSGNILEEAVTVDIQPASLPSALWNACSGNPALLAELQAVLSATYRAGWNEGMWDAGVRFVA